MEVACCYGCSLEGWEAAIAFQLCWPALRPLNEAEVRSVIPIVSCKSLYDSVHRIDGPKAPSVKTLVIDLAILRQLIVAEATVWGNYFDDSEMFRWIPTHVQLADMLTKIHTDVRTWWSQLQLLRLPFAMSR